MKISKGYRFSDDVCEVLDKLTAFTHRSETNTVEFAILELGKTILPPEAIKVLNAYTKTRAHLKANGK